MDSMVGYLNDRYRWFGWFPARADDLLNWIPARMSGLLVAGAAACLNLDWRSALRIMRRDAPKMKSPNAGYPEAAAAGALGIQLGGTNVYFGRTVEKPVLGDQGEPLNLDVYRTAIRLMYAASALAFVLAFSMRLAIVGFGG
jgi:adenosylcobinamide-phosphate synthase